MSRVFQPYPYQEVCIKRVISEPCAGLFLDMGLGKSIITLTAASELLKSGVVSKVLVVAPLSVARATWASEALKWSHTEHLRVSLILGSLKQRERAATADADVYVINRDNIAWLVDTYRKQWSWDMLVMDESTSFKSPSTKRFKALKKVQHLFKKVVALTGTPAPNGYMDLWAQIFLLDGGKRLGTSFHWFVKQHFFNTTSHLSFPTYELRPDSAGKIEEKISDIVLSLKAEDYLTLPVIVTNDIPVELDNKTRSIYMEMETEYFAEVANVGIEAMSAAAKSLKLRQIINGSVYDEEGNVIHACTHKEEALGDVLESLLSESAVIFYQFKHDIPHILKAIKKVRPKAIIKQEVDADTQDAWNNGEIDFLVVHPASTGYGLNLQEGGHNVIWYALPWSWELYVQANARLHRQGQTRPVVVHRLIATGTVDELVSESLVSKESISKRIHEYISLN